MKDYYVYILASKRNGTLYIGMTSDLVRSAGRAFRDRHHPTDVRHALRPNRQRDHYDRGNFRHRGDLRARSGRHWDYFLRIYADQPRGWESGA